MDLVRLSPSGKIIGNAGAGFVFRSAFNAGKFTPTVLDQAATVTTGTVQISNITPGKQYSLSLEFHARLGPDFSANGTFTYTFQYSTDNGVSWETLSSMTSVFVAASSGSPLEPFIESVSIPFESLVGAVKNGNILARCQVSLDALGGGADGKATFNSSRDYAVKLTETLA